MTGSSSWQENISGFSYIKNWKKCLGPKDVLPLTHEGFVKEQSREIKSYDVPIFNIWEICNQHLKLEENAFTLVLTNTRRPRAQINRRKSPLERWLIGEREVPSNLVHRAVIEISPTGKSIFERTKYSWGFMLNSLNMLASLTAKN
jgi:hypothetical protein